MEITDYYPEFRIPFEQLPNTVIEKINKFFSKIQNSDQDLETFMMIISLALKTEEQKKYFSLPVSSEKFSINYVNTNNN